jgi:hypothetical protein
MSLGLLLTIGRHGNQKPDFGHASTGSTAARTLQANRNDMKPHIDVVRAH